MSWRYRWRRIGGVLASALAAGAAGSGARADPSWTQPQAPFHIVGNIYYVGSKGLAAYLIASPKGHILIDGTVAENAPLIEANIRRLGFRLQDVKILLNGHAHHDHAGALSQLKRDTGAQLLASPGDVWALEHGRPRGDNTAGLTSWPAVKVDRALADGEVIRLGPIALTTVFTPGHTPGCTSWTLPETVEGERQTVVFLCSLTVAGNVLVGNRPYPGIAADYLRTFDRLGEVHDDVVLPQHPEVTDVLGRHESEAHGDRHAWSDSGQLFHLIERARAEYDSALGKAPKPPTNAARPSPAVARGGWRTLAYAQDRFAIDFPAATVGAAGKSMAKRSCA